MNNQQATFGILHMFCGLGGAALGFQRARAEWRGIRGSFRTIAGIDCNSEACEDFQNLMNYLVM